MYDLSYSNMILTNSNHTRKSVAMLGGILGSYQALRGTLCAPDVWFKVFLDGKDKLERRGGNSYDSRPTPHDFNHLQPCMGKCSCLCCILCCFWALLRSPWAPNVWFRIPWDGWDTLLRRDWYRYDLSPMPHDFNFLEPCNKRCSGIGGILAGF